MKYHIGCYCILIISCSDILSTEEVVTSCRCKVLITNVNGLTNLNLLPALGDIMVSVLSSISFNTSIKSNRTNCLALSLVYCIVRIVLFSLLFTCVATAARLQLRFLVSCSEVGQLLHCHYHTTSANSLHKRIINKYRNLYDHLTHMSDESNLNLLSRDYSTISL